MAADSNRMDIRQLKLCQDVDETWHIVHEALKCVGWLHEHLRIQAVDSINDLQDQARSILARHNIKTDTEVDQ